MKVTVVVTASVCKVCESPIIVTCDQDKDPHHFSNGYCANPKCEHHSAHMVTHNFGTWHLPFIKE